MQSQLALSVELTRLLPAAGIAAGAVGAALVKLARELRNSGSDIVLEEDLASIFRQSRIDPDFERKFRADVAAVSQVRTLSDLLPFSLQSGPGPTVQRGLRDPAYMPMIIQLSLLGAAHDLQSISDGLAEALRLRINDPANPAADPGALPTSTSLERLIQACSDQTSGFDWSPMFQDVETKLGLPKYYPGWQADHVSSSLLGGIRNVATQYRALTVPLLQASLDLMAAVQRLYQDSIMVIDSSKGALTMIVWAHHILGLTVHANGTPNGEVKFGNGHASVIINFVQNKMLWDSSSKVFLMNAAGEVLLRIEEDSGGMPVEILAERKIPILGYAVHAFESDPLRLSEASIAELCHYSGALALTTAKDLYDDKGPGSYSGPLKTKSHASDEWRLRKAMELVIGPKYFDWSHISNFASSIASLAAEDMPPPPTLQGLGRTLTNPGADVSAEDWKRLLQDCMSMSYVILSFSAVGDIASCETMALTELPKSSKGRPIWDMPMRQRDAIGNSTKYLNPNIWYTVIASLLAGRKRTYGVDGTCLLSGFGWSIFVDSFKDCDPSDVVPGKIWIQRGIPCSNGAVAHHVRDGPNTVHFYSPEVVKVDGFGTTLTPQCLTQVDSAKYLLAHHDGAFICSRRYRTSVLKVLHCAVGLGVLLEARQNAYTVDECTHGEEENHITLGLGMATTQGVLFDVPLLYGNKPRRAPGAPTDRICISMTYKNRHARWLTMVGNMANTIPRTAVLRGQGTCTSCFVRDASKLPGNLLLVL